MTVGSWLQLHPPTCSRPILPPVARSRAPPSLARAFGPPPPSPSPDYTGAVNQYSHEAARHRRLLLSRCLPFAHLLESPAHTLCRLRGSAVAHSHGALHNLLGSFFSIRSDESYFPLLDKEKLDLKMLGRLKKKLFQFIRWDKSGRTPFFLYWRLLVRILRSSSS